jgi:NUMOD4 motif
MPNEIWKQVVGWPDYAVSSWGRIFSFKRGTLRRVLIKSRLVTAIMSPLAHFADSTRTCREVREVPEAAVSNRSKQPLFDHSIT